MGKKIFLFAIISMILLPAFAKNTVVLRVSCVIPPIIQVSNTGEDKLSQTAAQEEERIRDGKRAIIKTVVSK
ncbi:MAG: hypothetical protein KKE55_03985 [Candidatus Omnitrophica bacterium]|nr:hypothetical protein [Candidatus Omnitrophota bacterium]